MKAIQSSTKATKTPVKRKISVSGLKKKLDQVFSEYVRQYGIKKYKHCYTCHARLPSWKDYQAGHYHSRRYNSLRYDERNVKIQCLACNIFKEGNKPAFALHLINEYKGTDILRTLNRIANQTKQFTRKELEQLIEIYNEKNQKL